MREAARRIRAKSGLHWLMVVSLILFGLEVGHWLESTPQWKHIHLRAYGELQRFSAMIRRKSPKPLETVVVTIEDQDYWQGDFAHRQPLNRRSLATLISAIAHASPRVIALDVDLRSPDPAGAFADTSYAAETESLVSAIKAAAENDVHLVIGKPLVCDSNALHVEASVVDSGLASLSGGLQKKIHGGYLHATEDVRRIPLELSSEGGGAIASFAQATARVSRPRYMVKVEQEDLTNLPYGGFMPSQEFEPISAGAILST